MAIPKPFALLIPRKMQKPVDQPDYQTDMRAIERWAKALIAYVDSISGGGFVPYASLTGPGETLTPGDLTQEGAFTVDKAQLTVQDASNLALFSVDPENPVHGVTIDIGRNGVVNVQNNLTETIGNEWDVTAGTVVFTTSSTEIDGSQVYIGRGSGNQVHLPAASNGTIGFFSSGIAQPKATVTGSRGGNAALASLLTVLDNYGLITDSTTP